MASASALLQRGTIDVRGRMPYSSNATLLVDLTLDDEHGLAIYKPAQGERPLWDFPSGLFKREVAAFELDVALGWDLVPPTVLRDDAPFGVGSVQQFVHGDVEQHYFTFLEDEAHHPQLQRLCAFDILANATDRKGGHVLVDEDGHLWAIDNGLSFHQEFKLRTVVWDFSGQPIPDDVLADIDAFLDADLPQSLADLLDPFERDALRIRGRALLQHGCFPVDASGRAYPWPLV